MPELTNVEATAAFQKLKNLGIQYEEANIYDENISAGNVVRTLPGSGEQISSGESVTVYISMGPERQVVRVPDVIGMDIEGARAALEGAGLKLGTITKARSTYPEGLIIDQDPSGTAMVTEDKTVNVVVSSEEGEAAGDISLRIVLPPMDADITLEAYQDGVLVHSEKRNPNNNNLWVARLSGEGTGELEVLIDNMLFQRYSLDFDVGGWEILEDNYHRFG